MILHNKATFLCAFNNKYLCSFHSNPWLCVESYLDMLNMILFDLFLLICRSPWRNCFEMPDIQWKVDFKDLKFFQHSHLVLCWLATVLKPLEGGAICNIIIEFRTLSSAEKMSILLNCIVFQVHTCVSFELCQLLVYYF